MPQRGTRQPGRRAATARRRPAGTRLSWLRAGRPAAPHIIASMPWATLGCGCLAGVLLVAILAHVAGTAHAPIGTGTVRLTFVPAVAALGFVLREPFRPLTRATPVPAWVTPAGHVVLAVPVLAATCWAQLGIAAGTIPAGVPAPAVYPLAAQLTGWAAVTVAAAACVGRTRYADLGGAMAVPVAFATIALARYVPATAPFLTDPPAGPQAASIAWYAVTAIALALTAIALHDPWYRYSHIRIRSLAVPADRS
jgi:hypothetical protein